MVFLVADTGASGADSDAAAAAAAAAGGGGGGSVSSSCSHRAPQWYRSISLVLLSFSSGLEAESRVNASGDPER